VDTATRDAGPAQDRQAGRDLAGQAGRTRDAAAEPAENLCDLVIFMQDASGPITSAGSEGVEVDDVVGSWFQWAFEYYFL
jgi:hypothetical protein